MTAIALGLTPGKESAYIIEADGTHDRFYRVVLYDEPGRSPTARAHPVHLFYGTPDAIETRRRDLDESILWARPGCLVRLNGRTFKLKLGPWRELELELLK